MPSAARRWSRIGVGYYRPGAEGWITCRLVLGLEYQERGGYANQRLLDVEL